MAQVTPACLPRWQWSCSAIAPWRCGHDRPAARWAFVAGATELAGGTLTLLGLLNPLGPIAILGSMVTAALTVHRGKPIWVTAGGAELPVTNTAAAIALMLAGPGMVSLDALFGTKVPWWFSFLALAGSGVGVVIPRRVSAQPESRTRGSPPVRAR